MKARIVALPKRVNPAKGGRFGYAGGAGCEGDYTGNWKLRNASNACLAWAPTPQALGKIVVDEGDRNGTAIRPCLCQVLL
jgi:hypothetical protein